MSHHQNKINNQSPNRQGQITQSLSDISDVSTDSPSDGYYLQFDNTSNEWKPQEGSSGSSTSAQHIFLGEGANQTYPESWSSGNNVYFYSSTVVNTIDGSSVASSDSYTNWYDQFTLPSGVYWAYCRVEGDFSSSSGQFKYIFQTSPSGGGSATSHAASGWSASTSNTGQNPDVAQALFEISSESILKVNIQNTSSLGTVSSNQATYGFLAIMKVG